MRLHTNANIMKEKHERFVAIRSKAKTQMVPSEDEIKNDCNAEVEMGMSQIENLVTPLKANEKDESKREIDDKSQTLSFNIRPFAQSQHQNPIKPALEKKVKVITKAKQLRNLCCHQ